MEEIKNGVSRRAFLTGTGAAVGGFAAGSIMGFSTTAEAAVAAGTYAWPATPLDLAEVKKFAVDGYLNSGGCCIGAAAGIIKQANIQTGGAQEWVDLESALDMFAWGAGGGLSWGTICGALNGAIFVLGAVLKTDGKYKGAVDDIMSYYANTMLPLDDATVDAKFAALGGSYPATRTTVLSNKTKCQSPLCHASVSTFCDRPADRDNPFKVGGIEKKVRCASITADIAAYTANIINGIKAGTYTPPGFAVNAESTDCYSCHGNANMITQQGKMDCNVCHDERDNGLYTPVNRAAECTGTPTSTPVPRP